jgi:hypothetical protein
MLVGFWILCPLLISVALTYGAVRLFGRRLARENRALGVAMSALFVPLLLFVVTMGVVIVGQNDPHDASSNLSIGLVSWTLISAPLGWLISSAFIYKPDRSID